MFDGGDVRKQADGISTRRLSTLEQSVCDQRFGDECVSPAHVVDHVEQEIGHCAGGLAKGKEPTHSLAMDIVARHGDPALEEVARAIFALFPRCMRCGLKIARYEDADVRILTNRVVHRGKCAIDEDQLGSGLSIGIPGDG